MGSPAAPVRRLLRAEELARRSHTEAKQQEAAKWADDRVAYAEAKAAIRAILPAAELWAAETG